MLENEVYEKVNTLEEVFAEYLKQNQISQLALRKEISSLHREMKDFKDEMKDFKDEMKDFKDEMKDFKDEMKDFKDGTLTWRQEIDVERKRMNKQWGEIANKMGTMIEDLVNPSIEGVIFDRFGLEVNELQTRIKKKMFENGQKHWCEI